MKKVRAVVLFTALVAAVAASGAPPPNLIIINIDDLGYADIGPFGSNNQTPHLDRMAREGRKLTNIILVMADDMGWGPTSYNGHPVLKTPNLDAMAANGLRFEKRREKEGQQSAGGCRRAPWRVETDPAGRRATRRPRAVSGSA